MPKSDLRAAEVGPQGWAPTYTNIRQRGLKLARRRLPKEEANDAEDKLHDSFVRLLERGPDPEGLKRPDSYALKTLQNVCIDRCNIKGRPTAKNSVPLDESKNDDGEQPMKELPDPSRGPEMDVEIKSENERLRRVLKAHCADLTKRERDLLALHLQGFTNDEIASAWSEDLKVVRVEMNALLAKMRYRLTHRQGNQDGESQS